MKFRWTLAPPQPLLAEQLAASLKISPLLAQCLLNRGLSEPAAIENFLAPRLKNLADPFLLPNMAAAVERLLARARTKRAARHLWRLRRGRRDFHRAAAGSFARARLAGGLLSAEPDGRRLRLEPRRRGELPEEISGEIVARRGLRLDRRGNHRLAARTRRGCHRPGPSSGFQSRARRRGAGESAAINLQPSTCNSFTELCSVGLAFKLAHALVKRGRETGLPGAAEFDLQPLLDLVALGTIADLVPLTGENRILVTAGLEKLNTTQARPASSR